MGEIQWAGMAAVGGMYAVFLVIGWVASRKVKHATAGDLILAGRSMPLWIATMTMTATWVDGGYLLGTAEGAFKTGGGIASGLQGGVCFGISLILGGLFFAKKMRRLEYTTLVDPFEDRFGKTWAAVLMIPALLGELIWGAELLAAIGIAFGVILGLPPGTAILLSAGIVTLYTMVGGMWSVAYTDAFQLSLVPIGMIAALVPVLAAVGGMERVPRRLFSIAPGDHALDGSAKGQLLGCERDADAGGHSLELLFPACARLPNARDGAVALVLLRR